MDLPLDLFARPPAMLRWAKYAPEFLEAMKGRKFRNPETGNENVFISLPEHEQQRIYEYWSRSRQRQQEQGKQRQRQIPEEALRSTTLVPNRDPARYEGVKVEYGALGDDPDEIKRHLHEVLGEAAKASGRTPEQMVLDLAGGGGLAGHLKEVKMVTSQHGDQTYVAVVGEGDYIQEYERSLFFKNGKIDRVQNMVLELDEDAPPGTGTRMLATQVAALKEAGGRYIKTVGAGCYDCDYVGYYVWPMLGFDQVIPENDVEQLPKELREELDDTGGGPPYYISELMSFQEGRNWWKENGTELEDLELVVQEDELLQQYVQKKAEKAGKTVGQFLHNASKKKPGKKTKNSSNVEQAPRLDKDDLQILSAIWDSLPKKRKKKNKAMTTKNATKALIDLAKSNSEFRGALLSEVAKEANINWNIRDFTVDEFSQHQMLRNLREGDLIEIKFEPDEKHPQRIATRLVASDFDPVIPGVTLRGLGETPEILADRGQDMPLMWEPGRGYPAYPVIQLKIVHSKLAAEAEAKSDKATAAQVEFAMDLAKEKGKDYSKSDLQKKTKDEISKMIEDMQKEETVASEKQVEYAWSLLEDLGRKSPSHDSLKKMSEVEVSKLIDKLKSERDKQASSILEALGGRPKLERLLGAREIKSYKNEVFFRWPNRTASKGTQCGITMGDDGQCSLTFMTSDEKGVLKVVAQYKVPKDDLAKTFEKQTGWFLTV